MVDGVLKVEIHTLDCMDVFVCMLHICTANATVKTFGLPQPYFGHLSCIPVVYVTRYKPQGKPSCLATFLEFVVTMRPIKELLQGKKYQTSQEMLLYRLSVRRYLIYLKGEASQLWFQLEASLEVCDMQLVHNQQACN